MNLPHTFVANTLAKAEQVNENFEAVVNEITAQGVELLANIQTVNANASSQIATLRSDVDSAIDDVEDELDGIRDDIGDINFMPNYNGAISISIGKSNNKYTVPQDGWIYAHCYTGDSDHGFYVNNKKVSSHRSSQYGGIGTYIGTTFPVSKNDKVHGDNNGDGYLFPLKGAN
jgi:hypothetical protein